ncbi:hypothetical protein TB2_023690 [Malus domestica]
MKEVQAFERELLEHVDMVKLAREENDAELESVGLQYFSYACSLYLQVQWMLSESARAGVKASSDWVMNSMGKGIR